MSHYIYELPQAPLNKSEFPFPEPTEPLPPIYIQSSIAEANSGAFKKQISFVCDSGFNGALTCPRGLLDDLEIVYEIIDTYESEAFDGTIVTNEVTLVDFSLKTDRGNTSFSRVPCLLIDDENSSPLIGLSILFYFTFRISNSRFDFFVPNDERLSQLQPGMAVSKMAKGSIIKPLEPIAEKKKADGINPPEPPNLANDWKIPSLPKIPSFPKS